MATRNALAVEHVPTLQHVYRVLADMFQTDSACRFFSTLCDQRAQCQLFVRSLHLGRGQLARDALQYLHELSVHVVWDWNLGRVAIHSEGVYGAVC